MIQSDQVKRAIFATVLGCFVAACGSKDTGVSVAQDTVNLIVQQRTELPSAAANRKEKGGELAFEQKIGAPLSKMAKRWEQLSDEERIKFSPCQMAFVEHMAQVNDSFLGHPEGDGKALTQCVRSIVESRASLEGLDNLRS